MWRRASFRVERRSRASRPRAAVGRADVVTYEFPIEFDVELSLDSEEALAMGPLQGEPSALGSEDVTTVVEMTGRMKIRHDQRHSDEPLRVEFIEFTSERSYVPGPRHDDPEQLRLPFVREGGAEAMGFCRRGHGRSSWRLGSA